MSHDGPISAQSPQMILGINAEQLTLFAVDSPVRTSRLPAKARALMEPDHPCGGKCIASLEISDHVGSLLRMSMLSELEALTGLSGHWKATTSKSGVSEWQLKTSAPLTKGNGCSLWPTIRASDGSHGGPNQRDSKGYFALPAAVHQWSTPTASMEEPAAWKPGVPWWLQSRSARNLAAMVTWPTPTTTDSCGRTYQKSGGKYFMALPGAVETGWKDEDQIKTLANWPTPVAAEANRASSGANRRSQSLREIVELYPTPTAAPYGSNKGGQSKDGHIRPSLSRQVQDQNSLNGKSRKRLNPRWVLQLMGFPSDWLSKPAVTVSYPPSHTLLRERYKDWGVSKK